MARIDIYNKNGDKVGSIGKGKNGKSAYQVALDNGFQGSEQDWLDSLKCADGIGVPIGGTTGQVLAKNSDENFDTAWVDEKGLENINLSSDKVSGILPESKGGTGTHSIIEAIQPYILNPNLLDNWYFADPINQRGQTEYTGTGYSIDRWRIWDDYTTLNLTDNGIVLKNNGDNDSVLSYYAPRTDFISGAPYTITLLSAAGKLVSITVSNIGANKVSEKIDNVCYIQTFTSTTNICVRIVILPQKTTPALVGAKLELGSVQTLAHKEGDTWVLNDPPPSQSLELLKCQRYFQVFETQAARPTKALDFRPTMRTEPTLSTSTVDSKTLYTASADL